MFRLFDHVATPNLAGTWPFLFDSLYGNKKVPLQDDQKRKIIDSLEDILRHCTTEGSGFEPFAAKEAAARLAHHYQRIGQAEDVIRVQRTSGCAFELAAEKASPSLAMFWLQSVYEDYRSRGMTEDAKRVHLALEAKAKNIGADMKTVWAEVQISESERESYLEKITSGGLEAALDRIAARFIPNAEEARRFLKEKAEKTPLLSTIPVVQATSSRFKARIGTPEDDPEGQLLSQIAQNIELLSPFLDMSLERTRARYSATPDDIVAALHRSPLFDADRKNLIRQGVVAYFEGDHVKAAHVLVPQIEHVLRMLLTLIGVPVTRLPRLGTGTMHEKNLNEILREEELRRVLGEDLWRYLLVFLADERGQNVRNWVCHGLLGPAQFGRQLSNGLIHVLLTLSLVRSKSESEPATKAT
jgi:lysyl-tRNA synthetase class 1